MVDAALFTPGAARSILLVEKLSRGQIVQYAGASGDYNPLHTDEPFATDVAGFPSVFAHGMLTMGMAGRALAELYGPTNLARFGGRFRAPVWPGDSLTAIVTVKSVVEHHQVELTVLVKNQTGTTVFEGNAVAKS